MFDFFNRAISESTTPPYPEVPAKKLPQFNFWDKIKIVKKYCHRVFLLNFHNQKKLLVDRNCGKKILFIYAGIQNIGDALMDLSGRTLLKGGKLECHVLMDESIAFLFKDDAYFKKVYTSPHQVDFQQFDFIVLNNLNLRSIKLKAKFAPRTPFTSMMGHFYGYDYNHILLSYHAINKIFQIQLNATQIEKDARITYAQRKTAPQNIRDSINGSYFTMSLGIGGREPYRTYSHWPELLKNLDSSTDYKNTSVVLLGSKNALPQAQEILSHHYVNLKIIDTVDQLTLPECASVIEQSNLFMGPDSGLLHVAHATPTPTIALFSSDVPPEMRITKSNDCTPVMADYNVDSIACGSLVALIDSTISERAKPKPQSQHPSHPI